jgi:hypothetical protein
MRHTLVRLCWTPLCLPLLLRLLLPLLLRPGMAWGSPGAAAAWDRLR